MTNLLKDLLPDSPREVSILVAAAEAGVASNLQDRVSQGMDVGTASSVVAGSFAASTAFRPEACSWAVSEIAAALGLSSPGPGPAPGVPPRSSVSGDAPTISATPGPLYGGYPQAPAPGGYPQGPAPGSYPQGGFPSAGQVPPGAYPYPPPPPSNAPGGYQPPPGPGYGPPPGPGFTPVTSINGLAIASLVLGVIWLFWLGSVVGLIFGLVALKQIKSRHQRGRGIAIAGVVLSILWLLLLLASIIGSAAQGS